MRIIVEIGHPAHVHHFKNMIWELKRRGAEIKIVAKQKDVTIELLEAYGFEYEKIGLNYNGIWDKASSLIKIDYKLLNIAKKFKPDLFISRASPHSAHVSRLINRPHVAFCDTEHATLNDLLSYPFTDIICTPLCYKKKIKSEKHVTFDGYKELAYLHPKYFNPDPTILSDLGLKKDEKYIILRFISWKASHDTKSKGFDYETKVNLINQLKDFGKIIILSEGHLEKEFEKYKFSGKPEKFHSLLYYATLCVSEGSTTAVESALLGIPTVHFESFKQESDIVKDVTSVLGYLDELINKYELFYTFSDQNCALNKSLDIVRNKKYKKEILDKRDRIIREKIDVTKFMVDFIENYPHDFVEKSK
ncbi:DUF354 domain-containing protein [Methanosarcina sp.]|uniref:DUF354 domain-containing protein n=1 Tax=Methanosarcina sp. TaxID=2213 RepID=UPI003BB65B83